MQRPRAAVNQFLQVPPCFVQFGLRVRSCLPLILGRDINANLDPPFVAFVESVLAAALAP